MTLRSGLQLPVPNLAIQKRAEGSLAGKWLYDQIVGMPAAGCPEWQTSIGPLFHNGLSGEARVHKFSNPHSGAIYEFAEQVVDCPYRLPLHFRLLKVTLPDGDCRRVADPGLPPSEILTAPEADEKALRYACSRLGALATSDNGFATYMDILCEAAPAVGLTVPDEAGLLSAAMTVASWNRL